MFPCWHWRNYHEQLRVGSRRFRNYRTFVKVAVLSKTVTSSCLFIETTYIIRNQNEKISQILLSPNIATGRLVKSVFIFKPARPAFAILNSTRQWNNWMKRD